MTSLNKMQKSIFVAMFFVCLTFAFFKFASAANDSGSLEDKNKVATTLVATTNAYDVQLKDNGNGKLKVSFNIVNKLKVQSDVRYGILVNKIDSGQETEFDRKISDETLTLQENRPVAKEIEYQIPGFSSGQYDIILEIRTIQGLLLDYVNAGQINLKRVNQGLEIEGGKCILTNISKNSEGSFDEGATFEKGDSIIAKCSVVNNSSNSFSAVPSLLIRSYSPYGEIFKKNDFQEIQFGPNEEKSFSLPITLSDENTPNSILLEFSLYKEGAVFSNKVETYLFSRTSGNVNAWIVNARFNKNYFSLGDSANITLDWDGFILNGAGSYLELQEIPFVADLFSQDGYACINRPEQAVVSKLVKKNNISESDLVLHVTRDCPHPTFRITLLNENNDQLAKAEYKMITENIKVGFFQKMVKFMLNNKNEIVVFFIVIIISWMIFHFIRRRMLYQKYIIPSVFLFFVLLFGITNQAIADTFYESQNAILYNLAVDKSSYTVNESRDRQYKLRTSVQRYPFQTGRPWMPGYHLSLEINTPGLGFSEHYSPEWTTISTNLLLSYGQVAGADIEAKTPLTNDFGKSTVESYLRAVVNGSYVLGGQTLAKSDINLHENGECGKLLYSDEINKSSEACKFGHFSSSGNEAEFGQTGKNGELKWKCENVEGTNDAECAGVVKLTPKCGETANKPICDIEKFLSESRNSAGYDSFSCNNLGWKIGEQKNLSGWGKVPENFEAQNNEGVRSWTCKGINGGSDTVCKLGASTMAVCGTASGRPSKEIPEAGLCASGKSRGAAKSWEWDGSTNSYVEKWKWTCDFFENEEDNSSYGCGVDCTAPLVSDLLPR
jgi:hypothetical protein